MINLRNHPTLAWVLDYWPSVVLVPTILLMIALLALVTHRWDRQDESVRAGAAAGRARAAAAGYFVRATRNCW
jgi:hypothetical protein